MRAGLRRLFRAGLLLRNLQQLRAEMEGIRVELKGLTMAVTRGVDLLAPKRPRAPETVTPEDPLMEVSYVDPAFQREYVEAEDRLTYATGQPPTEDEILEELTRTAAERDEERRRQ